MLTESHILFEAFTVRRAWRAYDTFAGEYAFLMHSFSPHLTRLYQSEMDFIVSSFDDHSYEFIYKLVLDKCGMMLWPQYLQFARQIKVLNTSAHPSRLLFRLDNNTFTPIWTELVWNQIVSLFHCLSLFKLSNISFIRNEMRSRLRISIKTHSISYIKHVLNAFGSSESLFLFAHFFRCRCRCWQQRCRSSLLHILGVFLFYLHIN